MLVTKLVARQHENHHNSIGHAALILFVLAEITHLHTLHLFCCPCSQLSHIFLRTLNKNSSSFVVSPTLLRSMLVYPSAISFAL